MIKLFISQPMRGKTDEEILKERKEAISFFKTTNDENVEVIDSFFKDAPHEAKPLWFLGKSLELLSTADYALFIGDWKDYRGCIIEHTCCLEYGINCVEALVEGGKLK